jgi:group I intron endonuclease
MVNYQNGKIYKLVCHTTGKVYIGSTTKKYLSQRLTEHMSNYKSYLKTGKIGNTSVEVLENNNFEIMLLELYPCSSKDELHARERYYCQLTECVNKYKNPGLTNELGKQEYGKQHREKNKESMKKYNKQYGETYYEKNKEAIREKQSQPYTCPCGSCFRINDKARHERSLKHQKYLKSVETVEIP